MMFHGQQLKEVLSRTETPIELKDGNGRTVRKISPALARRLDTGLFIGIGNLRRIRGMRPCTEQVGLNAGSRTTQRLKDAAGFNLAHPLIREHRTIRP